MTDRDALSITVGDYRQNPTGGADTVSLRLNCVLSHMGRFPRRNAASTRRGLFHTAWATILTRNDSEVLLREYRRSLDCDGEDAVLTRYRTLGCVAGMSRTLSFDRVRRVAMRFLRQRNVDSRMTVGRRLAGGARQPIRHGGGDWPAAGRKVVQ